MVKCGLVSVWKGIEVGGAAWKSGWGKCDLFPLSEMAVYTDDLFSITIDMLQVCLVC